MRKKERFFWAKSRSANCPYFLKKAENGKLCKHNQEGNFLIPPSGGVAHMVERSIRTFDSQACEESLSSFRQVRRSILRASIRDNECPFFCTSEKENKKKENTKRQKKL